MEMINTHKILVRQSEGKRPFIRPRCLWEDNIKMDLCEIGFGVWIGLIWLRTSAGDGLL
jgi:hypothetical protein